VELTKLAFINYTASGGGAGKICSLLHQSFQGSILYNCFDSDSAKGIVMIDNYTFRNKFHRTCRSVLELSLNKRIPLLPKFLAFLLNHVSEPIRGFSLFLGKEDFCFPGTSNPSRYLIKEPSLVHAHNLFPDFFDFRSLKALSPRYPLLITAHDCWLMTGHCAHPFDCNRFENGCGKCPDLLIPPAIKKDNTRQNLKIKNKVLSSAKPYLATPSEWLKEMFLKSKVAESFQEIRVIKNGVETKDFFPIFEKQALRKKYHLKENALIFSFVGNKIKSNPWKNFGLMLETLQILAQVIEQEVIFLCIGEDEELIQSTNFTCQFIAHVNEVRSLNELYNCSDYYLHLAKADTFPNAVLEAQSCGIPVFANPVCGIPEQIKENKTGWFLKTSESHELADQIKSIISSCSYKNLQLDCRDHILKNFSLEKMIKSYKEFYSEILKQHSKTFKI
jgi:glycosyltransferase involved in cell wall biosynthesis